MKKRIISTLLAGILLINMLSACGNNTADETTANKETQANKAESETEIQQETSIYDVLQPQNCDGYTFRILNNISNFAYTNIGEFELTGETLDDAIYERNLRVEDDLNISYYIETKEYSDTNNVIKNIIFIFS